MKNLLLATLTVLLFCQCRDNNTQSSDKTYLPTGGSFHLSSATASAYKNLLNKEKALNPIARMCAESKGYKKDEWDALNECSWAVETHQMSRHPTMVSRSGGQLMLYPGDSIITLTHKADEYFQFVDYLSRSKHFIIRVLRPLACPEYWLIATSDKKGKTVLPGQPVFDADKGSFLLSSSSSSAKINCPDELSFWILRGGVFQKAHSQEIKNGFHGLHWYNKNIWLGKRGEKVVQVEAKQE